MNVTQSQTMPEWEVAQWFNTDGPLRLADLRGQVVLIHAFQMLRKLGSDHDFLISDGNTQQALRQDLAPMPGSRAGFLDADLVRRPGSGLGWLPLAVR